MSQESRGDAPTLSEDVVVRRSGQTPAAEPAVRGSGTAARMPSLDLDLRVDLGKKLKLRGRGLETGLEGELRLTSPGGKLAVNGTVRAAGRTYAA